ncbi:MAG: lipoprotein insertase outer membrane protein LolB [Thiolinea sp.]
MRYWARAVPTPDAPVESVQLDNYGRPTRLQQSGWVIDYSAYENKGPNALPTRMTLEKAAERAKAKVVAKKWQTRF